MGLSRGFVRCGSGIFSLGAERAIAGSRLVRIERIGNSGSLEFGLRIADCGILAAALRTPHFALRTYKTVFERIIVIEMGTFGAHRSDKGLKVKRSTATCAVDSCGRGPKHDAMSRCCGLQSRAPLMSRRQRLPASDRPFSFSLNF